MTDTPAETMTRELDKLDALFTEHGGGEAYTRQRDLCLTLADQSPEAAEVARGEGLPV
jgi:hypothetical protein